MKNRTALWIGPCLLCLILMGCGGEAPVASEPETPAEKKQTPARAEIVVEAHGPAYVRRHSGAPSSAMELVDSILSESATVIPVGFHAQVNSSFPQEQQRQIVITPTHPFTPDQAELDQAANEVFDSLKTEFDAYTKRTLGDHRLRRQEAEKALALQVKDAQEELQKYQAQFRGIDDSTEAKFTLRKLERKIETLLQERIENNKELEAIQKQIDREQYITLLRVR